MDIQPLSAASSETIFRCPGNFDRTMILSADYGGFVRVWSLAKTMSAVSDHVARSMKQKARRDAQHAELVALSSPSPTSCVTVRPPPPPVFEYETCEMVEHRSFYLHRSHITSLVCDRKIFVTGSRDKSISINSFTAGCHP